jgi:hypothetical protein
MNRPTNISEAYRIFVELHGTEHPYRTLDELRNRLQDAGLFYDSRSTAEDWQTFYDGCFDNDWYNGGDC